MGAEVEFPRRGRGSLTKTFPRLRHAKEKGPLARISRWMSRRVWLLALPGLLTLGSAPPAAAGEILTTIRSRDLLRCGVSEGIAGFSRADAARPLARARRGLLPRRGRGRAGRSGQGRSSCRSRPRRAFPPCKARAIDLLVRNTTWTFTREALLGVQFPAVLFYDGQGFMVPAASGITTGRRPERARPSASRRARPTSSNLQEYAGPRPWSLTPVVLDSAAE